MILLDSDIAIDFLRRYPPSVRWLESLGDQLIALPGYVAMELMQGCNNKLEGTSNNRFSSQSRKRKNCEELNENQFTELTCKI